MKHDTDIVIVGAGLNGLLNALALSSVGLRSVVIDPGTAETYQKSGFDGRAYSIAHSSQAMLRALGLWDMLSDKAQPILDIKVSDGVAGEGASPFHVHFDHAELEEGPMGYMVEDRYMRAALLARAEADPNITTLFGQRFAAAHPKTGRVTVETDDGTMITGSVLAGCDGRGSAVAGKDGAGWEYDQASLVCAVVHERPHEGTAHQFFTPVGPLAILPLRGNKSAIVWTEDRARAETIHAMSKQEYKAALRAVFGDFLGEISLVGSRHLYPLGLSLRDHFLGDRTVLVGDSAHGIHPLAGQGLNLGIRDIAALAEVLADACRRGEDIGSDAVLLRYQEWRRFDTKLMAGATDMINLIFSNDNSLLRGVRDIGLGAVNAIPPLRRGFMRHAAGLTGDMPKLLQGRQI